MSGINVVLVLLAFSVLESIKQKLSIRPYYSNIAVPGIARQFINYTKENEMTDEITTTLNDIKQKCKFSDQDEDWNKLLKHLGKDKPDDEPLKISTILESNDIDFVLYCLRALPKKHYGALINFTIEFIEDILNVLANKYSNKDQLTNSIKIIKDYLYKTDITISADDNISHLYSIIIPVMGDIIPDITVSVAYVHAIIYADLTGSEDREYQKQFLIKYFG